jgi:hypothetical protein
LQKLQVRFTNGGADTIKDRLEMPFDYITNAAEFLLTSGINVMNTLFGEKFGAFKKTKDQRFA